MSLKHYSLLRHVHWFHLLAMLVNFFDTAWVHWGGTLDLFHLGSLPVDARWGLYSIRLEARDVLGRAGVYMSIPDFLALVRDELGVEVSPRTVPLYYCFAVLYGAMFVYELGHAAATLRMRGEPPPAGRRAGGEYARRLALVLCARVVGGALFFAFVFAGYSARALCFNQYIPVYREFRIQPVSINPATEVCAYGWNMGLLLACEALHWAELVWATCHAPTGAGRLLRSCAAVVWPQDGERTEDTAAARPRSETDEQRDRRERSASLLWI
jgi:hypothetical protein